MEEKKNTGLIIVIVILLIAVLGLVGYLVYDKVINKTSEPNVEENNNENNNENNDVNNNTDNNINQEEVNVTTKVAYKIGDSVVLTDSSTWYVMENSAEDNEFVSLLSGNNINSDYTITISNAANYVATTYKNNLAKNVGANNSEITEARLLTLEDISKLSGISVSNLEPGVSLENGKTPSFLYKGTTITSNYDKYDCNIMVCPNDGSVTGPGRMCASTGTDTEPIRPVITISKKYVK